MPASRGSASGSEAERSAGAEAPPPPPPPTGAGADDGGPGLPPAPPIRPEWRPSREGDQYPMRFDVAYPERLSRWKTLLRGLLVIPASIYLALANYLLEIGIFMGWIAVFLRRRYPTWLFTGMTGAIAFNARVAAYGLLLTDRYPSFEASHLVVLEYDEPPQGQLSRWRVAIWKSILLIPHWIVLAFLGVALFAVTVIAWFAILITGRYPRGLFGFSTGVLRWYFRTVGYYASFNDRFPPFALSPDAGPAARGAVIASAILGVLLVGGCTAGIGTLAVLEGGSKHTQVDYAALLDGEPSERFFTGRRTDPTFSIQLVGATDPADDLVPILFEPGSRTVVFELEIYTHDDRAFQPSDARLRIQRGRGDARWVDPALVVVNGSVAPAELDDNARNRVQLVFVIPTRAEPLELRVDPPWNALGGVTYEFE